MLDNVDWRDRMSFRLTLTASALLMISALAALLMFVQARALGLATAESASATMDTVSANAVSTLRSQVDFLSRATRALAHAPSLNQSSAVTPSSPAVGLIKGTLLDWPALDSIYSGYNDGHWLQVQRLEGLRGEQRERLGPPADAAFGVTVIRPGGSGELPTTRIFQNTGGQELARHEIPRRGYDARQRSWYIDALRLDQLVVSAPYLSFALKVPMITFSAPLRGVVRGVVGVDLKLDVYGASSPLLKFGKAGYAVIFDNDGNIIAHRDYEAMFALTSADPTSPRLPSTHELRDTLEGRAIAAWDGSSPFRGKLRWTDGQDFFFRMEGVQLGPTLTANVLLIAPEAEFAGDIRELNRQSRWLALGAFLLFTPFAWVFGSRMSKKIQSLTGEAARLQTMEAPSQAPVGSFIRELNTLGATVHKAQRAIWSFARLAPREIVRGVLNNTISTELGGKRQEITAFFTDVRGFTSLSEAADPDALMQQTSRYFTALTSVIIAEGGTVDKFIGDGIMAFWNAPNPQEDHCERACRAALLAVKANEEINRQFEREGLPPFKTRYGIHVGDAVVGNLGSAERMNYTILGNIVNLAARLEGMNKQYGTEILISEALFERVRHRFCCRYVDGVVAKGMKTQTRVYELLNETQQGGTGSDSNVRLQAPDRTYAA